VPPDLQRVVTRALKKNLDARYPSAGIMLEDLRAVSESLRTEAAPLVDLRSLARRLFKPRVLIPAMVTLVLLSFLGVRLAKNRAEVRWAKETALPEIARLIDDNDVWRNLVPAYRLAEEAEAVLGDDPDLATLFSRCSLRIDVRSEPPGALVSMKEYSDPDAEWSPLGVAPLEGVRVPIGIFRWKIEKEGFETVYAASSTWDIGGTDIVAPYNLVRTLDEEGSIPPGMVRVPRTETESGTLDDFFIGRYEVTNREYRDFMDAGGYRMREYWRHPFVRDGQELGWDEAMTLLVDRTGQPGPAAWVGGEYPEGQDSYPVNGLSWYEAAAYAEYAGKSLPTAAHWDVARGGLTPMLQWPQLGGFAIFAPFCNFGGRGPVEVGSLPNYTAYGAYDLPGNVREWCWNEAPGGRVVRGGSWEDNSYQFEEERGIPAMDRSAGNGIRLAFYPDANALPEEAFAFRNLQRPVDLRSRPPVSDAVFKVYREQFDYDPRPLDARVESRVENPSGWVLEKVSFNAAYGDERIPAYLFLPEATSPPYQTVVYFPGAASAWMPSSADLENYYEFTMFLSFLVRNGRAVLYPVYSGTFERSNPELLALDQNRDSHAYTEYCVQLVKDVRRSIDYLESREDIDSGGLAYYGMSWGASLASVVTAVEDRFRASVLVAGGIDGTGRPEISDYNYVTRVRVPTLILNGRYDTYCPPETCSQTVLDLLGTPAEDKRLILYETDHIPPRTGYIKEILAWLDHYLGPVR
ncbi:MAG: SUMF1/EgtB/PvdO family nonheme iron enzyme, partial [Acidobacteriota bacterium]